MTNAQVARITARTLLAMLVMAALAFPVDWLVWRARVAAGHGMDQVQVSNLTAAELKGNKEEYYLDGVTSIDCSRSLFRHAGGGACWYLRRHPNVVTRY